MRNAPAFASTDAQCDGVVLLHGIGVGSWSLKRLERALQRRDFATLNLGYASRKKPLEALAEDIHPPIAAFAQQCGGSIHFVAHSMGGLLTRLYIANHRPGRLARVVMLGTPNGGSEVADLLKDLSIYRTVFGPAGMQLSTTQDGVLAALPLSPRSWSSRGPMTAGYRWRARNWLAWRTTSSSRPRTPGCPAIPPRSIRPSPSCMPGVSGHRLTANTRSRHSPRIRRRCCGPCPWPAGGRPIRRTRRA